MCRRYESNLLEKKTKKKLVYEQLHGIWTRASSPSRAPKSWLWKTLITLSRDWCSWWSSSTRPSLDRFWFSCLWSSLARYCWRSSRARWASKNKSWSSVTTGISHRGAGEEDTRGRGKQQSLQFSRNNQQVKLSLIVASQSLMRWKAFYRCSKNQHANALIKIGKNVFFASLWFCPDYKVSV